MTERAQTVTAVLVVLAVALVASVCSGCGASAVRSHATAATVLAVATQGGARLVADAARADAESSCPSAEEACMSRLHAVWAPADIAVASTRTALLAYVEALSIAAHAGDGGDLWQPLALALSRVLVAWEQLAAVLREHDVEMPALPDSVLALARAIGGE